jgi:hypothetical protein
MAVLFPEKWGLSKKTHEVTFETTEKGDAAIVALIGPRPPGPRMRLREEEPEGE